ncbi:MAG TPA: hypothetical protein VK084_08285 [Chitinophagaceae bacterium]|nr:hypothetical protein [Chitinophagaceae bacterium]
MKKLKLEELNLGNAEVLSREELKKVLGGTKPVTKSGDDKCNAYCSSDDDCDEKCSHCDHDGETHGPGGAICVAFT